MQDDRPTLNFGDTAKFGPRTAGFGGNRRAGRREMIGGWVFALTFLAALGNGLMAGLFFVFSAFMMTALARLPAGQGMAAMQSINVAILNPAFGAAFFGTAILSAVLAVVAAFRWSDAGMAWLLAGGLLYLVGIIAVTMFSTCP